MATITIKDLSENVDLDRKAMQDISGGARLRTAAVPRGSSAGDSRIVDFRTGAVRAAGARAKQAGKQPG